MRSFSTGNGSSALKCDLSRSHERHQAGLLNRRMIGCPVPWYKVESPGDLLSMILKMCREMSSHANNAATLLMILGATAQSLPGNGWGWVIDVHTQAPKRLSTERPTAHGLSNTRMPHTLCLCCHSHATPHSTPGSSPAEERDCAHTWPYCCICCCCCCSL